MHQKRVARCAIVMQELNVTNFIFLDIPRQNKHIKREMESRIRQLIEFKCPLFLVFKINKHRSERFPKHSLVN